RRPAGPALRATAGESLPPPASCLGDRQSRKDGAREAWPGLRLLESLFRPYPLLDHKRIYLVQREVEFGNHGGNHYPAAPAIAMPAPVAWCRFPVASTATTRKSELVRF